jgi:polar amino acid transport system permease protein
MARYLPSLMQGFVMTVLMSIAIVGFGLLLGLLLAIARAYQVLPLSILIVFFVDLFRAIPPLVIIYVFYSRCLMPASRWAR